jgi:hypothetical protein
VTYGTSEKDRRSEPRIECDRIVRWKRPGKIEDHKAWMVDRAPSGLGFVTSADVAPQVGEILNIRQLDEDRWATIDRTVRVARATQTTADNLIMIGCALA